MDGWAVRAVRREGTGWTGAFFCRDALCGRARPENIAEGWQRLEWERGFVCRRPPKAYQAGAAWRAQRGSPMRWRFTADRKQAMTSPSSTYGRAGSRVHRAQGQAAGRAGAAPCMPRPAQRCPPPPQVQPSPPAAPQNAPQLHPEAAPAWCPQPLLRAGGTRRHTASGRPSAACPG